jgi:hypothetical protein
MIGRVALLVTAALVSGHDSVAQQRCGEQPRSSGANAVVDPDGSAMHDAGTGKIRWPEGSPLLVQSNDNPPFVYYRDILSIQFRPGLSAKAVRQFAVQFGAQSIGSFGVGDMLLCVFRFPDPGTSWTDLLDLSARLRSYPGVLMVVEMDFGLSAVRY